MNTPYLVNAFNFVIAISLLSVVLYYSMFGIRITGYEKESWYKIFSSYENCMNSFIVFTKIICNVQMNYFAHIKLTYVGGTSDGALFQYLKLQSPICIIGKFPCCRKQRIRRMMNSIVKLEKNNWSRFNEPCCKKCVVGKSIHSLCTRKCTQILLIHSLNHYSKIQYCNSNEYEI